MATKPNSVSNADPGNSATPSFEAALGELEGIVAAMEAGHMPLQDALDAYKRGVVLLRQCQATLTAAEQQIRILDADGLRELDVPQEAPPGGAASDSQQKR